MTITVDFTGKLVLITGGGRGIGLAIATAVARGGADVAITYTSRNADNIAANLASKYGIRAAAFACDVSQSSTIAKALQDIQQRFGKSVDIAVANAGVALWKAAEDNTDEDFRKVFEVNAFGPFFTARELVRSWKETDINVDTHKLNEKKQILFVSSISGLVAMLPQKQSAYNASKAAVTMLAKSLAGEWADLGVTVNAISPGYVSTDMIANPPDAQARQWSQEWATRTPAGRFATAEEIGNFVALLLSDYQGGMGFLTGSDVVVDGGYTIF